MTEQEFLEVLAGMDDPAMSEMGARLVKRADSKEVEEAAYAQGVTNTEARAGKRIAELEAKILAYGPALQDADSAQKAALVHVREAKERILELEAITEKCLDPEYMKELSRDLLIMDMAKRIKDAEAALLSRPVPSEWVEAVKKAVEDKGLNNCGYGHSVLIYELEDLLRQAPAEAAPNCEHPDTLDIGEGFIQCQKCGEKIDCGCQEPAPVPPIVEGEKLEPCRHFAEPQKLPYLSECAMSEKRDKYVEKAQTIWAGIDAYDIDDVAKIAAFGMECAAEVLTDEAKNLRGAARAFKNRLPKSNKARWMDAMAVLFERKAAALRAPEVPRG